MKGNWTLHIWKKIWRMKVSFGVPCIVLCNLFIDGLVLSIAILSLDGSIVMWARCPVGHLPNMNQMIFTVIVWTNSNEILLVLVASVLLFGFSQKALDTVFLIFHNSFPQKNYKVKVKTIFKKVWWLVQLAFGAWFQKLEHVESCASCSKTIIFIDILTTANMFSHGSDKS